MGVAREPILNGTPDTGHDAIVALKVTDAAGDTFLCTGVLIAPLLVLTAGHCLEDTVSAKVGFGPDTTTATWVDATQLIPHPQWQAISGTHPYHHDLALVRIPSQPAGLTPLPLLPSNLALQASDVGTLSMEFVGYGKTETGSLGLKKRVLPASVREPTKP